MSCSTGSSAAPRARTRQERPGLRRARGRRRESCAEIIDLNVSRRLVDSRRPWHYHEQAVNALGFGRKTWYLRPPPTATYSCKPPRAWRGKPRDAVVCEQRAGDIIRPRRLGPRGRERGAVGRRRCGVRGRGHGAPPERAFGAPSLVVPAYVSPPLRIAGTPPPRSTRIRQQRGALEVITTAEERRQIVGADLVDERRQVVVHAQDGNFGR